MFIPYPDSKGGVEKVEMQIFNRWGNLLFETTNPNIEWDGKNHNNNMDVPEGVYFYVCEVHEPTAEGVIIRTIKGSVTVIR